MDTLFKDIRHAVRPLVQSLGFSLVAIAALALGIGANTAIFSVVNSILLQPLPYGHPERLVRLVLHSPNGDGQTVSIPKFVAWRAGAHSFEAACAYDFSGPGLNLS